MCGTGGGSSSGGGGGNKPAKKKAAAKKKDVAPKYNQAYWAKQKADGVSQADMKAEQDKVGIKKAYSGDKVITKANSDTAALKLKSVTGSMATLQNGGVTKTEKKSGLLGEKLDTTYDYKGGPKIVTRATDPVIKGVRLGKKTSTTFVDGTEYATKTGSDPLGRDAKVTRPETAGHITDKVKIPSKNTPAKLAIPKAKGSNQSTASNGSSGPALATNQPDNLKNLLAVKKNKQREGKRSTRNKNRGVAVSGGGFSGLNIIT